MLASLGLVLACGGDDSGRVPTRDGGPDGSTTELDGGRDMGSRLDFGTDMGPPPDRVGLCEACAVDAACGPQALCGALSGGERVCLKQCTPEFNDCPRGFECAEYEPVGFEAVCLPVGTICCVDEDADGYGVGAMCMGPDCNDADITRNPGADELCDGTDQDCDENVDEAFVDCGFQRCEAFGSGMFQETGESGCAAGACVDPAPMDCGLYTCSDGGEMGDDCGVSCTDEGADSDARCVPAAHCDDGGCEADFANGSECDEDSDCSSNHCDNGYCCSAGGTCCAADLDCPGFPGAGVVCDRPSDCEGTRGTIQCNATTFACETISGVADDSACDDTVLADDCGLFADLYCDGSETQPRPSCPSSCTEDSQCDAVAHCDPPGFCFPDLPDGEPCNEPSDCGSGHCQNGFCCATGDCCRTATDCPGSYGSPPTCDDARACQGTRDAAQCVSSQCGTAVDQPDDSACTTVIEADTCGLYPTVRCNGNIVQSAPACATMCTSDSDCDEPAHCDGGACVMDLPNGAACDENSDCQAGHCQNGFCCASGDCCSAATDCPGSYAEASQCSSPSSCQGQRRDAVCTGAKVCQTGPLVDDDSGCVGLTSNECGLFPSVMCSASQTQESNQAGRCDMSCAADAECDPGAFCNTTTGQCEAEGDPGDPCTATNQCSGSSSCIDGVCCTSACSGTCEACNVPGSLGTCTAVPDGTDPAGECGALDCSSYFDGWSGDTCFEKLDAPASAVACNGSRSCQTAADVCPGRPVGPARTTCDDTCQDPNLSTCSGTSSPACNNTNPGSITCGAGICQRSVDRCVGGSDNMCVPGPSTAEVCNDLDDDCDGVVDNNPSFGDGYENNDSCGAANYRGKVLTDGSTAERSGGLSNATIYSSGDVDYYRVFVEESGGSDCVFNCGDRERSTLRVTISVPAGAGSYQLCVDEDTDCSFEGGECITVAGGASGTLTARGDSAPCACVPFTSCSTSNDENFIIRVRGIGAPASECLPYSLTWQADEAC
ncbi:MAG: hypothetical protein CMN30_28190 [Sandaracinus sp.]|nr:hypothetical protein [Sandaracinus sp.]